MAGVHGMMMIGRPPEVVFINTVNLAQANIYELMGSPTAANVYIFENTATISAATQGGWALQTGAFPAGSTLRIINKGAIRGGGGNGGIDYEGAGGVGGTALVINFPVTIDNTSGTIYGGGGGGGAGLGQDLTGWGGGGGTGIPAGNGGALSGWNTGRSGTATEGGAAIGMGGAGGAAGAAGAAGYYGPGQVLQYGGRGGYSVETNGNAVTWTAIGDRKGSVV